MTVINVNFNEQLSYNIFIIIRIITIRIFSLSLNFVKTIGLRPAEMMGSTDTLFKCYLSVVLMLFKC